MKTVKRALRPPLRDSQTECPACLCRRCLGEVYPGETVFVWDGSSICRDCFQAALAFWIGEAPEEVARDLGAECRSV